MVTVNSGNDIVLTRSYSWKISWNICIFSSLEWVFYITVGDSKPPNSFTLHLITATNFDWKYHMKIANFMRRTAAIDLFNSSAHWTKQKNLLINFN